MTIDEALQLMIDNWERATITQRVLMRRIFRRVGREDLIPD